MQQGQQRARCQKLKAVPFASGVHVLEPVPKAVTAEPTRGWLINAAEVRGSSTASHHRTLEQRTSAC